MGGAMTVNKNDYYDNRVKNKITQHHHGDIHQTVVNKIIKKGDIIMQEHAGYTQISDKICKYRHCFRHFISPLDLPDFM
nr:hypothetical protein BaRGS_005127 [Batillaria attramentaria]